MEWSKDKTLKLVELLQVNANLWNSSLCDTRRDKQKRKEEMRAISDILGVSVPDITKKMQHLRTQYNRESAKATRINVEEPNDRYVSSWYAFEYLHFLKDSSKPFRVLQSEEQAEVNDSTALTNSAADCKLGLSPVHKTPRMDAFHSVKPEVSYPSQTTRDEFAVFGEYIANELRSLKGEKNLLVAKKKIQDVIFEVKMGLICESRVENSTYTHSNPQTIHNGKIYTTQEMNTTAHMDNLTTSHPPPTSGISEIIINSACHYSNFKVDNQ